MQIYRTKDNESIYDIAREYGVSPMKIAEDNELEIRGRLPLGREVRVLTPSRTYNVKSTDTLDMIAKRFKTSKEALLRLNPELRGREKIYSGQLLTVKECTPSMGMISTNGYLYSGTPRDRLIFLMPYLSYVTVCSAVYRDGKIRNLFPVDDTVSFIRSNGRAPMLRIYLYELPKAELEGDFANAVVIIAKSGGFSGISLSSLNSLSKDRDRLCGFVLNLRRVLIENDLLLFAEGDVERDCSYVDYADAGILTYDKIHRKDAPSFNDGERACLNRYAEEYESSRAFVEIPSFAYSGGQYMEKGEAVRIIDRKRADTVFDGEKKLLYASYGRHKRRDIVLESLENTKAKLDLVSELGYMGVSLDIGRTCISDLMAMASAFDIVGSPIMTPRINQDM